MDLRFSRIEDSTDFKKEYIVFIAKNDIDLGEYMIFDNSYNEDGSISNKHRHTFIFPDIRIKKNDFVRLYTREGNNRNFKNSSKNYRNSIIYEFFWDLDVCVWNEKADGVGIIKIEDLNYTPLED